MRIIIITIKVLFLSTFIGYSQDDSDGYIIKLIDENSVELHIDNVSNLGIGDFFEVYGPAQIIHPATGNLIERDNVLKGRIKVSQIENGKIICQIIDPVYKIHEGDQVYKISIGYKESELESKDITGNFENHKETETANTIYSNKKKIETGGKNELKIIKMYEKNDKIYAILNKGKGDKPKEGTPKVGRQYYILVPIIKDSKITGEPTIEGMEQIGQVRLTIVESGLSEGIVELEKEADLSFIIKNHTIKKKFIWDKIMKYYVYVEIIGLFAIITLWLFTL